MRILLIEDDGLIGDGIKNGLEKLGFTVDWFSDGNDGHEALLQTEYDAVVLDLGLPGRDGLSILKDWRARGYMAPVLILTARGDVDERIAGLNNGADDYLGKPFSLKEVQARLNALIRRCGGVSAPEIRYREITFNPQTRKTFLNGREVTLSPRETALLELLLFNRNKVLSRESIENKIYSWDDDVSSNAVEVHIHHLRKKLGKNIVKTINKIGYIIED
ncbi:MAG: response regulator [Alphaproteobacteria bacterium]|nr:response regulator [Alphaproteobacteria bacterium]